MAFAQRCANKVELQKLVYYDTRDRFGLSSQLTVRAISKVVEAFKRDKSTQPKFRARGAVPYDQRIMSWKGVEAVSLLTLDGRQIIPTRLGGYQAAIPQGRPVPPLGSPGHVDLLPRPALHRVREDPVPPWRRVPRLHPEADVLLPTDESGGFLGAFR